MSTVDASATGGIPFTKRLLAAAASTNATLVKATQGRVYGIRGHNANAAVRYLKLYDKATAPTVGTDTPRATYALKASDTFTINWSDLGLKFTNGIGFALTVNGADTDTTALTANDIVGLNIDYD